MSALKRQIVNEIHKNAMKNFPRRHVIQKDIDDLWQADLIDMQNISSCNKNYNYILVVIDTFSKYAWAVPLKNKDKNSVSNAFNKILYTQNRCPKNLQTDLGTEFYNDKFKDICRQYSINHYSTFSTKKASIVERFIRTIKSYLYKEFNYKGNYRWIDRTLDDAIEIYNHKKHRTIGMAPNDVDATNKLMLLKRYGEMNTINKKTKIKLKKGDFVRISKHKGCFEKGYTPNWSTELFQIQTIKKTCPTTYLLIDTKKQPILGSFYVQELQKTRLSDIYLVEKVLRRKGDKIFVKWLGLPSNENSWIHKMNVL